jgi:hypothetical protein
MLSLPWCVRERNGTWHVVRNGDIGDGDRDFHPILCHAEEGIVAPSAPLRRKPTCLECVAILQREEQG